jgi:DNA-binding MarR family transcriptional regulator
MRDIAYLHRNKTKKNVLEILDKPKTPTQISKSLKIHRSSVSRILLELEKKGFVKCLNPNDITARFYDINKKGKEMLRKYKEFIEK